MTSGKVLIIGGRGYVGEALSYKLLKKKIDFEILDNLLYGNIFINQKIKKPIKFNKKDVRSIDDKFIKKFSIVIFLAALSNNPILKKNQNISYKITESYTIMIAKLCKKHRIKFIYPSSCSVYGYQDPSKKVNERSDINPLTYYSKNKANLEIKLLKLANENFKPIIFRPATVFGFSNSMRFDLVINMFVGMALTGQKIFLNSDGKAFRPFVDLDTLTECFIKACKLKNTKPIIVNIGYNNFNLRVIDVAKIISKLTKSKIIAMNKSKDVNKLFKDDLIKNNKDSRSYKVDFLYAQKIFNLKSNINIESKIKKLIRILDDQMNLKRKFTSIKFYRLQKLQSQINNKIVDPITLIKTQ